MRGRQTDTMGEKRNTAWFVIRIILGISLLATLFVWQKNPREVLSVFRNLRLEYIGAVLFSGFVLNWISCLKWNLFLQERGINLSIFRLLGLYLIGRFFSNFMPSMIGGDLTRTYLLGRQIRSQSKSAASVFLERFTGLLALVCLALTFAALNFDLMRKPLIGFSVASIGAGSFLLVILLLNPGIMDWIYLKLAFLPKLDLMTQKFKAFHNDILFFRRKPRILAKAMFYSFTFHGLTCVALYICCLSAEFRPPFLDIAVITPIVLLLTSIPVSPNNIGWWEWSFSVLLVEAGAGRAEGLAIALIIRGMNLVYSCVGAVLFLFEKAGPQDQTKSQLSGNTRA
jgi:hypothetical protein